MQQLTYQATNLSNCQSAFIQNENNILKYIET